MSTTSFSSQGSVLAVLISSLYAAIPAVVGILVPKVDPEFDDTTNLDSPAGFRERVSVGKQFFSETYEMIWNPGNYVHRFLEDAAEDQTIQSFQITSSDPTAVKFQFQGYVSFQGKLEARKAGRAMLTINGTGAVTKV